MGVKESGRAYRDNSDARHRIGNRIVVLAVVYEDFERKPDPPDVIEFDGLSGLDSIGEVKRAKVFECDVEFGGRVIRYADAGHYYKMRRKS
jgi:hypothetical protein